MNLSDNNPSDESRVAALVNGYTATAILYSAVELDLPDHLGAEPISAESLARKLRLQPDLLHRLLRAMSALGLCEERADGTFVLTDAGACLKSGASSPLREQVLIAVEQYFPAWAGLADSVRSGQPAFEKLHGKPVWQARVDNPRLGDTFSSWLAKETSRAARIIAGALDFGGIARIADIGGGLGELTAEILRANPQMTGVLFDQAAVIAAAKVSLASHDLAGRIDYASGDFFDRIPLRADMLILKSVLHDWDDDRVRVIIRNCLASMDSGARLMIIERLLPERAKDDAETIFLDIHMMAVTGGKERDLHDFVRHLTEEGFVIDRVGRAAHFSLIDARPR